MTKQAYKAWQPKGDSSTLVAMCDRIITSYLGQGYRLTLRQLYYQLVSKNVIANTEKQYKMLGNLVSRARLAGMLDWDAIEDRVRQPWEPPEYADLDELVRAALSSYRLPRWHGQREYAELWVEKDALAGVLRPLASKYHATLMVNRGYSSQSAMYESAKRVARNAQAIGARAAYIFYLGDLDPSGEDMVRDIQDRLHMFRIDVQVVKIALTIEQVRQHNPPPNPAKVTDSRAKAYIEKYGASSWEVDALSPPVLNQLISTAFENTLDMSLMAAIKEREERDKAQLKEAVIELMKGAEPLPKPERDDDPDDDDWMDRRGIYRCPGCHETYESEDDVEWCANFRECPGWDEGCEE